MPGVLFDWAEEAGTHSRAWNVSCTSSAGQACHVGGPEIFELRWHTSLPASPSVCSVGEIISHYLAVNPESHLRVSE